MKKIAFLSLLSAVILFSFPACDSPREEAREDREEAIERRAEEIEEAADDADNAPLEDAADRVGDRADDRE